MGKLVGKLRRILGFLSFLAIVFFGTNSFAGGTETCQAGLYYEADTQTLKTCPAGYYCPEGAEEYEDGQSTDACKIPCPGSFTDGGTGLSSEDQCVFTLQPGDAIDTCDYYDVNTFGSCGGDNYFCPGYSVTVGEVEPADNITWCSNYMGQYSCPADSTVSADHTYCTCDTGYYPATITGEGQTCEPRFVWVDIGYYLPAGATTPELCPGGHYCGGSGSMGFGYDVSKDQGISDCPDPNTAKKTSTWKSDIPSIVEVDSVSLNTWRTGLWSVEQCAATYVVSVPAGVMRLESVGYSNSEGEYSNDTDVIPYYTQLNPGYYLHTPYTATYCTTGNANGMFYQFAEECPQNSYCPGLKSMPACDATDSVRTQFGYTSFTYGDDLGAATCAWGTNGNYVYSDVGAESKDFCYLNTSGGYAVYDQGAGQVMCQAGQFCIGGTTVYYGEQSGLDMTGGFEYCPLEYPESASGNNSADGCYGTIRLEKNDGSGVINDVGDTGAAVLTVYNLGIGITLPSTSGLELKGYTFNGTWGTDPECSGTTYNANTVYYDISSEVLYACRTLKRIECASVNCDGGNACYLPAGSETPQCCPAGSYCTNSSYLFNPYETQGLYKCPAGFTSLEGGSNKVYRCFVELQAGEILEYTYDENDTEYYGTAVIRDCDSVELSNMMDSSSGASMTKGYYCGGGQYLYGTTSGLGIKSSDPNKYWFGYSQCPGSFNSAPSTISSYGQCAFTLNPGDSVDICYYTDINTFGSCAGNTSSYCPGYTATIDEIGAESNTTWCSGNNGNDYINWSGINTCPANSTTSADQTHCTCNYGYQVSDGAATITNATQECVPVSVTVPAGSYLPAGSLMPAECGASDAYCPGATCSFSTTMDCGRESCPDPKEDERVQADNVDWVDSAKLPDERKKTSVVIDATLKTWRKNLQSINQCFVTYTIQNDAGTMLLESIYYDSDSEQYTDDRALIPYYTRLNPGYYLHTSYSATYCSSGNAMYYQFAEECPQNSYCPGFTSMPACDDPNYSYGDEIGRYECLIATAGYYPWSEAKSSSVGQCYLITAVGEYVAEQGAGTVTCPAGSYCPGGAQIYYNDEGGGDFVGGIESCPSSYPESAAGSTGAQGCYLFTNPGYYVSSQGLGQTLCPATDYCPGGIKIRLFISDGGTDEDGNAEKGGNYGCPNGYLDNTALGKELIRQCLMEVPGGYYVAEPGATQYVATDPGYFQPTPHSVGYGETSGDVLGYEYIACSGQDKYQDLTAQTSCNTVSWGYYTTKNGAECTDGVACTGQAGCDGGYYCTARTGIRKACPDARTHIRTTQFTSTNSNLIMPTVTLDMFEEDLTNTSVTARMLVGDITGCQVLSWYTAKPVAEGGKASLYEYAMYVGDEENGEYSNTTAWGYMSVQPGYYLSSPATCGAYAYYHVLNECESGQYCPGKDRVACNPSNQATVHTSTFGVETCPTNYGASPARATAQNQCYLTTTAGTYVAEAYAAPVTCPGGSWCPSAQVNYGETGAINACPVPSEHAMTTFPSSWYPVWQDGYAPGSQTMSVRDVSQQTWTEGIGSIDGCRANYFMTNDAGDFNVESVMYNSSTGIYETQTSNPYYGVVKPGFYLKTRYTENYCDGTSATADKNMYYQTAVLCPANSVCPGFTSMPKCSSGKYNDTMGMESCTASFGGTYPYSDVGNYSNRGCYTIVPAGHYVYKDGNDHAVFEECPQGTYSGGNGKYYASYNLSYSCDSCATNTSMTGGTYPFTEGTGATKIEQCYEAVPAGYYISEQYGAPEKCPYASYSEQKKIVFYGETTQCDQCTNAPENAKYDISVSGWTNANCPWECNDGYNQTVDANGNPMCGQMCTVSGMNYIKSSTGLSIPLYSSKGAGWARAIGVSLDGGQTACYGRLEQDTGNAPSGSLRVNVGGTKYYAVE